MCRAYFQKKQWPSPLPSMPSQASQTRRIRTSPTRRRSSFYGITFFVTVTYNMYKHFCFILKEEAASAKFCLPRARKIILRHRSMFHLSSWKSGSRIIRFYSQPVSGQDLTTQCIPGECMSIDEIIFDLHGCLPKPKEKEKEKEKEKKDAV
jgi:hypothetical protein